MVHGTLPSTPLPLPLPTATITGHNLTLPGNVSEDGGGGGDGADIVEPEARWALVALGLIPVWILTGNLLVLLAVLGHRQLRTLSNYVIASLAVTDFLLALIVVPLGTYQTVSHGGYLFYKAQIKLINIISTSLI